MTYLSGTCRTVPNGEIGGEYGACGRVRMPAHAFAPMTAAVALSTLLNLHRIMLARQLTARTPVGGDGRHGCVPGYRT